MQGSAPPPSDRVVATLWRRGLVSSAMDYARAALGRRDRHHAVLQEQLEALRAGQELDDHGEDVPLTVELVGAMVDRYRYHEARCLLRAVAHEAAGPIGQLLDDALAPFPPGVDPSYEALHQLIAVGQAPSALRALGEVVEQMPEAPDWLSVPHRALRTLVSGEWRALLAPVEAVTRDTVLERLRLRDLEGALAAAEAAHADQLAGRLRRLHEASQAETGKPDDPEDQRTVPIEGIGMAMFQVRMGALQAADGSLRKLLRSNPDDEELRRILADVLAVRRALGAEVELMPPRVASVHWLSKTSRADGGKWSRGDDEAHPRYGDDDAEESTNVLNAAHEAELLLKLGKTEQALSVYKLLAIRHPQSDAYRARIVEIEALIEHNLQPVAYEVTAKHDLSALIEKSLPTGAKQHVDMRPTKKSFPRFAEMPDDGPTLVDEEQD